MEIASFLPEHERTMHDKAPAVWMNPALPPHCPIVCINCCGFEERSINVLFLLLGQMLGCCKLFELKYFRKHAKNHIYRTHNPFVCYI
ncbi:unnamed protein product [Prunus brigantina]